MCSCQIYLLYNNRFLTKQICYGVSWGQRTVENIAHKILKQGEMNHVGQEGEAFMRASCILYFSKRVIVCYGCRFYKRGGC